MSNRWLEAGWRGDLLALLGGALLPLAFAPFQLVPLAPLALTLQFALWLYVSPRKAAWRGFLFGMGQFGVGVSWVYVAVHDFGFTGVALALLLTLLFVATLALCQSLAGLLALRLAGGTPAQTPRLFLLLYAPAGWLFVEWLRSWLFTGFPWLQLGYSQIDGPLRGWAPLFGVLGLTAMVALSAGALLLVWLQRRRVLPWAVALWLLLWGGGALLQQVKWTQPLGAPLSVSLIQGDASQESKWDNATLRARLERYAAMSRQRFGTSRLIVWPENAITVFYHEVKRPYFDPLAEEAQAAGSSIVAGVPVLDGDGEHYYTSMVSIGNHDSFYYKSHLVPFGEFMPLESLLRGLIAFFDLPMSGFTAGSDDQPPLQVAGVKAAVSICYEDAFGAHYSRNLRDASILLNGSNNGWYGNSLAPHQHLQISRMRALEMGRPMARATTTGISALIDAKGNIISRSPQFVTYILDGNIQPMQGTTPYGRWQDGPLLLLMGIVAVVAWRRRGVK